MVLPIKERLHDLYSELSNMKGRPENIMPFLADAIIHFWELLDPLVLGNLSRAMPHRIEAVKSAKGWYTQVLDFVIFIVAHSMIPLYLLYIKCNFPRE